MKIDLTKEAVFMTQEEESLLNGCGQEMDKKYGSIIALSLKDLINRSEMEAIVEEVSGKMINLRQKEYNDEDFLEENLSKKQNMMNMKLQKLKFAF